MILTSEKVVALVPIETPARPRFVIKTASTQAMTRSGRFYTPEELAHGGRRKKPISEAKLKSSGGKCNPNTIRSVRIWIRARPRFLCGLY